MPPISTKVFLSWAHADASLKQAFLDLLRPHLRITPDFQYEWWEDTHLTAGEKWEEEILGRINEADLAMHLLSPAFLASDFIRNHEVQPFLQESKMTIPVMLVSVPLDDPNIEWHGLKSHQIFTLDSKSFQQLSGHKRQEFVSKLAAQLRTRLQRRQGTTPWRAA